MSFLNVSSWVRYAVRLSEASFTPTHPTTRQASPSDVFLVSLRYTKFNFAEWPLCGEDQSAIQTTRWLYRKRKEGEKQNSFPRKLFISTLSVIAVDGCDADPHFFSPRQLKCLIRQCAKFEDWNNGKFRELGSKFCRPKKAEKSGKKSNAKELVAHLIINVNKKSQNHTINYIYKIGRINFSTDFPTGPSFGVVLSKFVSNLIPAPTSKTRENRPMRRLRGDDV